MSTRTDSSTADGEPLPVAFLVHKAATVEQENNQEKEEAQQNIWCEECGHDNQGQCFVHGKFIPVSDTNVLSFARLSLPAILMLKKIKDGDQEREGVFAKTLIEPRTRFGPLKAPVLPQRAKLSLGVFDVRVLTKQKHVQLSLSQEEVCNWMMFVRPAKIAPEVNVGAFQLNGKIYFVATKRILCGTELRVWYIPSYGHQFGKQPLPAFGVPNLPPPAVKDREQNGKLTTPTIRSEDQHCDRATSKEDGNTDGNHSSDVGLESAVKLEPHIDSEHDFSNGMDIEFNHKDELKVGLTSEIKTEGETLGKSFMPVRPRGCGEADGVESACSIRLPTKNRPVKCYLCGCAFPHLRSLTRHMQSHPDRCGYVYENCGVELTSAASLTRHFTQDHKGQQHHLCKICGDSFQSGFELKQHKHLHTGDRPFVCDKCGASFALSSTLRRHARIHTGEKPYPCKKCPAAFRCSSGLRQHLMTHTGEKPYTCETCGTSFTQSSHLKRHRRIHTGEKPFVCQICGKRFAMWGSLKHHLRTHKGDRPFVCDVCGSSFTMSSSLKSHMRTHSGERPFSCETCGSTFATNGVLKVHRLIHTGEKPYVCEDCGATFTQASGFRRHRHLESGNTTSEHLNVCGVCKLSFKLPTCLKYHAQAHKKKPFSCDNCGATFICRSGWRKHMQSHAGDKKYSCEICRSSYTTSGALKGHMRSHTEKRPYSCEKCGASYSSNTHLTKHMEIHTDKSNF